MIMVPSKTYQTGSCSKEVTEFSAASRVHTSNCTNNIHWNKSQSRVNGNLDADYMSRLARSVAGASSVSLADSCHARICFLDHKRRYE